MPGSAAMKAEAIAPRRARRHTLGERDVAKMARQRAGGEVGALRQVAAAAHGAPDGAKIVEPRAVVQEHGRGPGHRNHFDAFDPAGGVREKFCRG